MTVGGRRTRARDQSPFLKEGDRTATIDSMTDHVRRKLSLYSPSFLDANQDIRASVLIPVFQDGGETRILLTKRTDTVKYHKGEISFPGGMYEREDQDALATAMRECWEEIGVEPQHVEILGRLDDMHTYTGFVISPFVGLIPYPYDFKVSSDEVSYLIYLPVPFLLSCTSVVETVDFQGGVTRAPAIYYENERIWGATCRMLLQFRRIIQDEKI
jgi:8-oxo-dGTP pyrophosphatase MutT (NUDIX family)